MSGLFCGLALMILVSVSAAQSGRTRLKVVDPREMFSGRNGEQQRLEQTRRLEILRERTEAVHSLLGSRHISRRGMRRLERQGLGPALLRAGADPTKSLDKTETLNILLIRIGFKTDRSGDLTSITEDGEFQLSDDDSLFYTYPVDRPPHDKAFYQDHLDGLAQFYKFQSGGRLNITSRILPEDDNASYKMSDIADYGPGEGASWTIEGLERLVVDMITTADDSTRAYGHADLSEYADEVENSYVIFVHAGGDWQSDVLGDSPNDIPTFFVTLGDSVPLDGGGSLRECSIIPETTSQDGLLGSIAGALYHEFGHSLGLPDIYDTETGLPRVGYWDLMDSGPNLVSGFWIYDEFHPDDPEYLMDIYVAGAVPPSLSAWCRWYLGWLDVDVITGGDALYHLPASQVPRSDYATWYSGTANNGESYDFDSDYPQALIGGVSPRDFFLIENRWVPKLDLSDIPDRSGVGPVITENSVILYMAGDSDPLNPGSYRNTGYYDWFQPGGGLLVWHVNREIIQAGLPDNTINKYGLGLRLVEADGLQDVGVFSGYPIGIMGSAADPFHAGTSTQLGIDGRPSSHAFDGSRTGFHMSRISAELPTMSFRAGVAPLSDGSPILPFAHPGSEPRMLATETLSPALMTIAGVEREVLIFSDASEAHEDDLWLYAVDTLGEPVLTRADPAWPVGAIALLDGALAGPPVVDALGVAGGSLLVGTTSGLITCYSLRSDSGDLQILWGPLDLGEPLLYAPAVTADPDHGAIISACLAGGRIAFFDTAGLSLAAAAIPGQGIGPAIGEFRGAPRIAPALSGDSALVLFGVNGWAALNPPALTIESFGALSGETVLAAALLPTADGVLVSTVDSDGRLIATPLDPDAGPEAWTYRLNAAALGEPALADLDGDGRCDLIIQTADRLYALDADGAPLGGYPQALLDQFPLDPELRFRSGLAVFDADDDGFPEIFCNSTQGHLFGFDSDGDLLDGFPLLWADRTLGEPIVGRNPEGGRILWLPDRGGRATLGGYGETQVDGRIIGYLPGSLVEGGRTTEWLGLGGGPSRQGPSGEAAVLAVVDGNLRQEESCFAYPNPARGEDVFFRSHPEADGVFKIAVYTLEGEIVDTLRKDVSSHVAAEIHWSLSGRPSGVYLCRIEMPVPGGVEHHLLTLAVER